MIEAIHEWVRQDSKGHPEVVYVMYGIFFALFSFFAARWLWRKWRLNRTSRLDSIRNLLEKYCKRIHALEELKGENPEADYSWCNTMRMRIDKLETFDVGRKDFKLCIQRIEKLENKLATFLALHHPRWGGESRSERKDSRPNGRRLQGARL